MIKCFVANNAHIIGIVAFQTLSAPSAVPNQSLAAAGLAVAAAGPNAPSESALIPAASTAGFGSVPSMVTMPGAPKTEISCAPGQAPMS